MVNKIYLASHSPRRSDLLNQIGLAFDLLVIRQNPPRGADVDEEPLPNESADDYVKRVCTQKALNAWERMAQRNFPRMPVLAADTTVSQGDEIFGKPADAADATRMLSRLSGTQHRVLTGVAVVYDNQLEIVVNESLVRFSALSDETIRTYVESGEPMGKAGAYGIQGRAAAFIPSIFGSYSGVMGLPLFETTQLLEQFR